MPTPPAPSSKTKPGCPLSCSKTIKVHVGRSFVEHVADTQSFGPWRPNSVALADFAEHGSGVVLCRLWPDPTKVAGGDVGRLVVVEWLGEVGWRWGGGVRWRVCGDVEMLGWIVKICVCQKSESPVINVSQYQSPLYPPWKLRWLAGKSRVFHRRYIDPNGCLSIVRLDFRGDRKSHGPRTPCRPNWLPSNPCRLGYMADQVFLNLLRDPQSVNAECDQKPHQHVTSFGDKWRCHFFIPVGIHSHWVASSFHMFFQANDAAGTSRIPELLGPGLNF